MKLNLMKIAMKLVGGVGLLSAMLVATTCCPVYCYQDEEPESVRKLRKF